eukprot:1190523-Prorocentrum_minimum.AAC.1
MADTPPPDGTDDGYDYEDEEEEEEEDEIALDPNHPLLARAQIALKQQLNVQRLRVEEALRERTEDLRVTTATFI